MGTYLEGGLVLSMGWVLICPAFSRAWSMCKNWKLPIFSRKIENQIWHFDRAFEHNLPSPPQGGGGEGGNKQAYLLKFKCRGDVESLI